jgi:hypothetical protein
MLLALLLASGLFALPAMYAQQATPPPAAGTSQGGADRIHTAISLLDRIDRLVAKARKDVDSDDLAPVGTSGRAGATAKVTIAAADLDEIRAEIAQVKLLLQSSGK